MATLKASVSDSPGPISEGQDYDLLAEVDYVTRSIEKSLDRLSFARSLPLGNNLLIAFSIAGSGIALVSETAKGTVGQILMSPAGLVMAAVVYGLLILYGIDYFKARAEAMHRARIVALQVDLAGETLKNLKSWVDRSEMPYRLRKALALRSSYLEALLIEARASGEKRSALP